MARVIEEQKAEVGSRARDAYERATRELFKLVHDRGGTLMRAEADRIKRRLHDDLRDAVDHALSQLGEADRANEKG